MFIINSKNQPFITSSDVEVRDSMKIFNEYSEMINWVCKVSDLTFEEVNNSEIVVNVEDYTYTDLSGVIYVINDFRIVDFIDDF